MQQLADRDDSAEMDSQMAPRMTARLRAALVLVAALVFAAMSIWGPSFTGFRVDQLPHWEARPAVQPIGYAFAIWSLIYLGLIASGLYGLIRRAEDPNWDFGRLSLIGSLALGAVWLWTAVYASPILTTAMVFAMLTLALWALPQDPRPDEFWLSAPLGLYAGWLTVAGFVGLGVILAGYGLFPSSRVAAWIMLPIAFRVAWVVIRSYRPSISYPFAAGWGFLGIALNNMDRNPEIPLLCALAIAGLIWLWWHEKRRSEEPAAF